MTDPPNDDLPRLVQGSGPGADLLRDAREVPAMSEADRDALRAAIAGLGGSGGRGGEPSGTGGGGAAPAGAGGGGGGTVGGGIAGVKALALAGLAAMALAAAAVATSAPPPSPSPSAADPTTPPSAEPRPPPSAEPTASPAAVPPIPPHVAPPAHAARPPTRPATPPAAADTLARETALVGEARAAASHRPQDALRALEAHARDFPRGELAPERDWLRAKVLHALGRDDEARALARGFGARYPGSPYGPAMVRLARDLGAPSP